VSRIICYKIATLHKKEMPSECYRLSSLLRDLISKMKVSALSSRLIGTDSAQQNVRWVYQEIWGALTAYNLVRLEIATAPLSVKCEPTEISFTRVFHLIQYELHWAAVTRAQGKLPSLLQRLHQRLVSLLNEERPGRQFDRAVKALPQRYTVRVLKTDLN
jgi:hypothetical protein